MGFNDLSAKEISTKTIEVSQIKTNKSFLSTFLLAVLAGMFIGFGAIFATIISTDAANLPFGVNKLLAGIAFSVGLILVSVCGAELFTGNNLLSIGFLDKKIKFTALIKNLSIVYIGNFLGALLLVLLVFTSKHYFVHDGLLGKTALDIAKAKVNLGFGQAVALGILCNIIVCLAVWASYGAKTYASKVAIIIPIISMFVAAGFEHCVANMYFLPFGWAIKTFAPSNFWDLIQSSISQYNSITWSSIFLKNLLPVTIGNLIGGGVFIGGIYWLIYLKNDK
jgi:formate transporter